MFINHIANDIDLCEWNYPKCITAYYRENMFALVRNGVKYPRRQKSDQTIIMISWKVSVHKNHIEALLNEYHLKGQESTYGIELVQIEAGQEITIQRYKALYTHDMLVHHTCQESHTLHHFNNNNSLSNNKLYDLNASHIRFKVY